VRRKNGARAACRAPPTGAPRWLDDASLRKAHVASKPTRFFRPDNKKLPDVAHLDFIRPPGKESVGHEEWTKMLRNRIAAVEADAAAERAKTGGCILGRKAVRTQRWSDRPRSREPRRQMSPRVACHDKWRRIEALRRNRAFLDAYKEARAAFVAGDTTACFPAGTYWLAKFARVPCATAPPS
jgi:hypothetical protein